MATLLLALLLRHALFLFLRILMLTLLVALLLRDAMLLLLTTVLPPRSYYIQG